MSVSFAQRTVADASEPSASALVYSIRLKKQRVQTYSQCRSQRCGCWRGRWMAALRSALRRRRPGRRRRQELPWRNRGGRWGGWSWECIVHRRGVAYGRRWNVPARSPSAIAARMVPVSTPTKNPRFRRLRHSVRPVAISSSHTAITINRPTAPRRFAAMTSMAIHSKKSNAPNPATNSFSNGSGPAQVRGGA
jgi:hypothetical protein